MCINKQTCQKSIQQFFLKMSHSNQFSIFVEEKHQSTQHLLASRFLDLPESIPYLKRGDSNSYLDQFFQKKEDQPEKIQLAHLQESKEPSFFGQKDEEYQGEQAQTLVTSSFHNFQKHLTVCLKHSIDIQLSENSTNFEIAAQKMWRIFKNSNCSTKKILHYLLGEKNQHQITSTRLRQYGLQKVYEIYDQKTLIQARIYLAKETLKQIREGKLQKYIINKKLKDKDRFKKYVGLFIKELQSGYLRKRLSKQSIYQLQNY